MADLVHDPPGLSQDGLHHGQRTGERFTFFGSCAKRFAGHRRWRSPGLCRDGKWMGIHVIHSLCLWNGCHVG
ncbi:hypothetical protein SBV1_1570056 [Verrucomicrobia bacterium]|nr:hypothetical protein SBV1_1570056 [Verrucomicrobiota bacterium]